MKNSRPLLTIAQKTLLESIRGKIAIAKMQTHLQEVSGTFRRPAMEGPRRQRRAASASLGQHQHPKTS